MQVCVQCKDCYNKQSKQQTKNNGTSMLNLSFFCINSIFMYNIYHLIIMLTIAWYWPEGSHNGLRQKAECHYDCPNVVT